MKLLIQPYKILIGEPKMLLLQLKTKVLVDLAGPLVPSEPQNLGQSLKNHKKSVYLNNNSLIVQEATEIKDVMVDLKNMLSNTSKIKDQSLVLNILMLLETKNVKLIKVLSPLLEKPKEPLVLNYNPLQINNQLMLPLTLATGACINLVS